ncbi:class I SAM-dependent methyltransferase [Tenacibaculum sp. AHE15PA]|uniref:class I SAM-dependent methyltransferase n=1 Tax=unclassified Tenacibaculum TaxID=2635139 RepID=UPI001C4F495C|nr:MULTISPECIES: class I SAM-dependent methyltransferase [unclassified Tenacibaculum]QXP74728.1 class I SAM-dependent methyltransferase [Tenacibaculum sp. AHE14PA]QXP76239.1 class I SAM-dependent methyltransferase [Tenacibaculum sp. AHE15PA]
MTTKESDCKSPAKIEYKNHWNTAYTKNTTEKLGWFEEKAAQTMSLISKSGLKKNATILNVGVGSSVLIDELLADGYTNLIASDLSEKALTTLKDRLAEEAVKVTFIADDLIQPEKLNKLSNIDLWNDRAVLHFFLKEEEKAAYFNLLKQAVVKDGFVIIAVFALDGAEKCCGLELQRYNSEMLQERLGNQFKLISEFNHTFVNPYGGKRPYIYTLFQRINK